MTWHVRQLFDEVTQEPRERWEGLVAEAEQKGCPASVAREVRSLLSNVSIRGDSSAVQPVAMHAIRASAERAVLLGALERIGPYRIERVLGRGGFGVVYLGRQEVPVERGVAIKVLDPARATPMAVRHFEIERQVLASLNHPNIATMLDAGQTDAGQLYLVMELVGQKTGDLLTSGWAMTRYCDERKLPIRERLRLFLDVCRAVQHAHSRGVIHRDLKPSNILVTEINGQATPKVIDFGIAKLLQADASAAMAAVTQAGAPLGTLAYMSPEQASGDTSLTTLADIYSLGAVLYELLAGVCPVQVEGSNLPQVLDSIIAGDTQPASQRLSALPASHSPDDPTPAPDEIASRRGVTRRELESMLRRELEWIPQLAMQKELSRRYPTVADLIDDVQRYLDGRPLRAGPDSRMYVTKKFVRRHKAAVIGSAVVLTSLVAGAGFAVWGLVEARASEFRALQALATAEEIRKVMTQDVIGVGQANGKLGPYAPLRDVVLEAAKAIATRKFVSIENKAVASQAIAQMLADIGEGDVAESMAEQTLLLIGQSKNKSAEYAVALSTLAQVKADRDEFEQASRLYSQSAQVFNRLCKLPGASAGLFEQWSAAVLGDLVARSFIDKVTYADIAHQVRAVIATCESRGVQPITLVAHQVVLAQALIQDNQPQEAERLLTQAIDLIAREAPNNRLAADAYKDLANLSERRGDSARALSLYTRGLDQIQASVGPNSPALAEFHFDFAYWHLRHNRLSDALEHAQQDRSIRLARAQQRGGTDAPAPLRSQMAVSLTLLAEIQEAIGNFDAAEQSAREAGDVWLKDNSIGDFYGDHVRRRLALVLCDQQKFEEAARLCGELKRAGHKGVEVESVRKKLPPEYRDKYIEPTEPRP